MLSRVLENFCYLLSCLSIACRDALHTIRENESPVYRAHVQAQREQAAQWRRCAELSTDELQAAHDVCETLHMPILDYNTQPLEAVREPSTSALRVTIWQQPMHEDDVETLPSVHAMKWLCRYEKSEE